MNFVALPESNYQIIEVTLTPGSSPRQTCLRERWNGSSRMFGVWRPSWHCKFSVLLGHIHDTYQVGNSEKHRHLSTNIQALCCSHVLLRFFVLAFLAFLVRPLSEIEAPWKGQAEQESDHAMRLETKADRDSSLRCAYDLPPRYHCISMCCVSAAWAFLTPVFMLCQTAALLTSSPDAELRFQGEGLHDQFFHEKMPCFMSWQERWN